MTKEQSNTIEEDISKKKRVFWERIRALSGIAIALVGITATYLYNEKQSKLHELQAVESFFRHLLSDDIRSQKLAAASLKRMSNKELAAELILVAVPAEKIPEVMAVFGYYDLIALSSGLKNPDEIRKSAELAYDYLASPLSQKLPSTLFIKDKITTAVKSDTPSATVANGWAYLGTYSKEKSHWKTKYFDFAEVSPESLMGMQLKVRKETGTLNVREGMPADDGGFHPVIDVLKPGSEVSVEEVKQWHTTGFWWAKITYRES